MKKHRSMLKAVAGLVAVAALSACSGSSDNESSEDEASDSAASESTDAASGDESSDTVATESEPAQTDAPDEDEPKGAVAMGFPGADITIWNDQLAIMKPIIEEAGYEFLTDDPQYDINRQVNNWQTWINRGDVKAIMGFPAQADSIVPVTQEANEAGIPVFGYLITWEGTQAAMKVDAYKEAFDIASTAATEMKANGAPDDMKVVTTGRRDNEIYIQGMDGLKDGLLSVMPNATLIEQTARTREEGYNVAKAQYTAEPDIYVWLGMSNDSILGVYQGLLDSGVAPDDERFYLASRDATNETLDLIKIPNSIYRTATVIPARMLAEANAKLLIDGAEGRETQDIVVPGTVVTAENADEFYVD
ncbi:ABC-type sugar transport system substrate-binding protein [Ilumatobacter fluminis]|uniref:ABC-type sugar transport system substrate-binding protein n=1 Tax=Ilumatobacter fluminis TaxID=467091 RepID=A0A4R7HYK9_9ACTN|nr:substrate-binding domain-containing protein [Ilumatobacter fluminis]TDT15870.1 ABC-type sugar transport system substrate-binding protein [Ilumatobacter fluminis]